MMRLTILLFLFLALGNAKPNIAVLPFTGDQTVTPEQLTFITGKFSSELLSTAAFTILDRGKMDFILKEQGFQQSGTCNNSECKVQMGQLLGVDNLVVGNMVKFGPEYAFRIEYIDVGSGQIVNTVELTEKGDLYEVYKSVCEQGAKRLAAVVSGKTAQVPVDAIPFNKTKPLSLKRKIAAGLWGTALVSAGTGVFFQYRATQSADDYDAALTNLDLPQTRRAYNDLEDAKKYRNVSAGISIGTALVGIVLWLLPEEN